MQDKPSILFVDDDAEDVMLIEEALTELSCDIHHEIDPVKALLYLDTKVPPPSIIVLDLNMPKMTGTQVLFNVKANQLLSHIPVIIYSTSMNNLEKDKCMELGAHAYIIKPYTYADTLKTAEYMVSICKTQSQ